ncbi:3-deoxy-D-manno-octulosonic acid transferase [Yoonia sp.]|uniref:3-deoxy-D-manno-octulosonic acid transferase n=1 Tax=Yoonia sp. TaxID=2212373 RepID=UPI002FD87FD5
MKPRPPSMRLFFAAYSLLWAVVLPLVLVYFLRRGRKDPLYARHLAERFGTVPAPLPGAVWVHTVSLGEFRSAVPLLMALLARGERLHITCMTPAGRREAETILADRIASGAAIVTWLPLDMAWTCRRFLKAAQPKAGILMEMEFWPRLIETADRLGVPVFFGNAQYPEKTFQRDNRITRPLGRAMGLAAGAMVKSDLQRERFSARGVAPVHVTGELRFDQPVPAHLVRAGQALRESLHAAARPVVTIASAIEGEDDLLAAAIRMTRELQPETLFVYVPRAPERFDRVAAILQDAGLAVLRRSDALGPDLGPKGDLPDDVQVLLGDSMGEMYAYLAMADRVIVGGGFVPKGAHNISEPLALSKPVWVGAHIWTIAYPAQEALAAGVLQILPNDPAKIAAAMTTGPAAPDDDVRAFFADHAGALDKTLAAFDALMRGAASPDAASSAPRP